VIRSPITKLVESSERDPELVRPQKVSAADIADRQIPG